ncbi:hypothetical protein [Leifsonia sp. AG29]|uniref:hypothetical protein n=1 Tax=Leifsonia sp. AG29 TaxID=2598860 RepID=UPI00131CADD1|nr:hypothetical protein [Leifsonia sp. AG29]
MFVEGTLRWQVTEDCPRDLLMALAVRDLVGLKGVGDPVLPPLAPSVAPVLQPHGSREVRRPAAPGAGARGAGAGSAERSSRSPRALEQQWLAWFAAAVDREHRPLTGLLQPPHFPAFDRAIDLQDVIIAHYDAAAVWAEERHQEYASAAAEHHARRAADIVDVVHEREHELRRQAGYFRLDIDVLPLAESGAWIVGPHTVVVSASLREDSAAFRDWFRPMVAALV